MTTSGAFRIFRYNWPWYTATFGACALASLVVVRGLVPTEAALIVGFGVGLAGAWAIGSLAVSFLIYDVSPLSGGRWMAALFAAHPRRWVALHAGLDAEVDLAGVCAEERGVRLDIFDPRWMKSGSIHRARAMTKQAHAARPADPMALPLADGEHDAAFVVFTAHEIRDAAARLRFFRELHRVLAPGGRLLLVEHLRDAWNFVAFGPGFLHFLPRAEWLRLARETELSVVREVRVTPFVMALLLERGA